MPDGELMSEPTAAALADRVLAQSKHMRFCLEKSRPGILLLTKSKRDQFDLASSIAGAIGVLEECAAALRQPAAVERVAQDALQAIEASYWKGGQRSSLRKIAKDALAAIAAMSPDEKPDADA